MILDIHSHNMSADNAIINCDYKTFNPKSGLVYSAAIHPWDYLESPDFNLLMKVAKMPEVVAIGECGIDRLHGDDINAQIEMFEWHVRLSESLRKPLIIHCVKGYGEIIGVHRRLNPAQKWIVHGFRGNANIAEMLLSKGIALSFGAKFNPEALQATPDEMLFAETDEFNGSIRSVISQIAFVREASPDYVEEQLKYNISATLGI